MIANVNVTFDWSCPDFTASEIGAIVREAHRRQTLEGNPIKTPETDRVVAYWKEYRPNMVKRLRSMAPDAPHCLASYLWDSVLAQAKATKENFPTFSEALEVAQRDNLLMEPEEEADALAPVVPAGPDVQLR